MCACVSLLACYRLATSALQSQRNVIHFHLRTRQNRFVTLQRCCGSRRRRQTRPIRRLSPRCVAPCLRAIESVKLRTSRLRLWRFAHSLVARHTHQPAARARFERRRSTAAAAAAAALCRHQSTQSCIAQHQHRWYEHLAIEQSTHDGMTKTSVALFRLVPAGWLRRLVVVLGYWVFWVKKLCGSLSVKQCSFVPRIVWYRLISSNFYQN